MLGSALIIGGAIWPSIVPSQHSLARTLTLGLPDRALYLPTSSHFLIVNETSLSLCLSVCLSLLPSLFFSPSLAAGNCRFWYPISLSLTHSQMQSSEEAHD